MNPWWERHQTGLLAGVVVAGVAIRVVLLPTPGFVGDIDTFVGWVGDIARSGLPHAYDANLSFGPVMAFVWWLIGVLDPALVGAVGSSDPAVRVVMKLPAVAADLAIAGIAWSALRQRPGWATLAVAVLLLHPAIWFVSAWWGTYDSVYTAFAVAAFALAIRKRNALAVVAIVLAVMTKPQAAPLAVPLAAWFLGRANWQRSDIMATGAAIARLSVLAAVGVFTLVLLWLPFLAANGPSRYVDGLGRYQGELYAMLSISAWNPWWIMQQVLAGGRFILDSALQVGGLSFRIMGYGLTGLLLLGVAACVAARPTPRVLALGLAAASLVAFEFLTTMHERYVFAVLPMLVFLIDDPRIRRLMWVFGATFFFNLLSATDLYLDTIIPVSGPITVVGSLVNVGCLAFLLLELVRSSRGTESPTMLSEAVPAAAV